jgi:membrane-associated phospholipid phosphatase
VNTSLPERFIRGFQLPLQNLKLRATLASALVVAFTSTGAFAQNSSVLNQPQTRTAIDSQQKRDQSSDYVRAYSLASARNAFNVQGIAEPTLAQPLAEETDDPTATQSSSASSPASGGSHQHGLIVRSIRRTAQDQKELYAAPFHRQNLKWDALFLVGTAALIATDRQSSRAISLTHVNTYRNISNGSISGLSVALGGIFVVGLTGDHPHARETGMLGLETLVNTFVVYAPMQFIFGRERPTEGTGNGRFFVNRGFNTSFPGGHGMFAMAMATTIAHEYRKPWVEILAYGAGTAVIVGRIGAKMHFNSDMLVGSSLGFLISRQLFYAHCDPDLSAGCRR